MRSPPPGMPGFALWEPHIRSFVALDDQASCGQGPLQGLRVGIKDIIDVAGLPTRNGSEACSGVAPAEADAAVVAALRKAGACVVGKTVTTEFAFTDPTDCRNPYDVARSPGGSSSGSGAAVAAGLVDFALGTQTAGSLCRPAAYCGVVGFKPGYGVLSTEGVTPLARSFDSVGIIARSVGVARTAFQVVSKQTPSWQAWATTSHLEMFCGLFAGTVVASSDAMDAMKGARSALGQCGISVSDVRFDIDLDAIVESHRTVMLAEAAIAHGALLRSDAAKKLGPNFSSALKLGAALTATDVTLAHERLAEATAAFWQSVDGADVILTLPVPEGAPMLGDTTGFQNWLTPWTVFGGPLISLPWGLDRFGLPRAVMLAGPPGSDMRLLENAALLETLAPTMPQPVPPQI